VTDDVRVLVVDDDFKVASIHRQYVERVDGFTVIGEAHTGSQALQLVAQLDPDLVLLDIYLPDMSGLDVMQRLQSEGDIDVIAITAARDVATLRAAMRYGALHYLVKPFTFPALREKLASYASWASELEQTTITGQAEVDRLIGALRSDPPGRELPKGLSETTMNLIATIVRSSPCEVTAVDVAEAAGVSRVTARRYLDHLRRQNQVRVRSRYGVSGRPVHLYSPPGR
jgi:response regulator of citrate/malate metabolism